MNIDHELLTFESYCLLSRVYELLLLRENKDEIKKLKIILSQNDNLEQSAYQYRSNQNLLE